MRTLVTGHRLFKLQQYDIPWIQGAIRDALDYTFLQTTGYGLSGMADGVDLWFLMILRERGIPYSACIPFEEQGEYMSETDQILRDELIAGASMKELIRNSAMVSRCNAGMVVFDGNKGGTHNVFQQLIEAHKPFVWINPVWKTITEITTSSLTDG